MEEYTYTLKVDGFDLDSTLDCGQTFRWYKDTRGWTGIVLDRVVCARQHGELLELITNRPWDTWEIERYFGLTDDLGKIAKTTLERVNTFSNSKRAVEVLEKAFEDSWGLRILRQDPYEMTISYLFSIQTSIPQIQKRLERLAALFPENQVEFLGRIFYTFPSLEQLKRLSLEDWLSLDLGFRAEWVYGVVQHIDTTFFDRLTELPLEEKMRELLAFKGIGYKVASCITLFGYGELASFPVDVWIKKIMEDLFDLKGSTKKLMKAGMEIFGSFAGYAQEYLFREYRTVRRLGKP